MSYGWGYVYRLTVAGGLGPQNLLSVRWTNPPNLPRGAKWQEKAASEQLKLDCPDPDVSEHSRLDDLRIMIKGFYSYCFLVTNISGGFQAILDLRGLNWTPRKSLFKMLTQSILFLCSSIGLAHVRPKRGGCSERRFLRFSVRCEGVAHWISSPLSAHFWTTLPLGHYTGRMEASSSPRLPQISPKHSCGKVIQ